MKDQGESKRSDASVARGDTYRELLRPQFHFTARAGWLNDPNGLLHADGEYHLFYQFQPVGQEKGWGHAIGTDLVHWDDLGMAIPAGEDYGQTWSGSAIVDHGNVLGLQSGAVQTLCAFFTGRKTWAQYLATSTDRGRTWTMHPSNPVVPTLTPGNRDPKVLWHEPTQRWIMALWCRAPENTNTDESPNGEYTFLASTDLLQWERLSSIPGFFECPDLFELPVAGEPGATMWVLVDGSGDYVVGRFDGTAFAPKTDRQRGDLGPNFYATQTWRTPDGRTVQLAWMRNLVSGKEHADRYPDMPFDQQMAIPCELTLQRVADRWRVLRYPVRELQTLRGDPPMTAEGKGLDSTAFPVPAARGDTFDIEVALSRKGSFSLDVYGCTVRVEEGRLELNNASEDLAHECGDATRLRILVDRASIEIFANDGVQAWSCCFLNRDQKPDLRWELSDGSIAIWKPASIWK